MPRFQFTAVDAAGRPQAGEIEASSLDAARQQLLGQGLRSVQLSVGARPISGRVSGVTESVASVAATGLPLAGGLSALAAEATSPRVRRALQDLSQRVAAGESLEAALQQTPAIPGALAAVVRAGQRVGQLPLALARYVDLVREAQELQRTLLVSLTYPCLLLCGCFAVFVLLATIVMPMYSVIFNDFGIQLPSMTVAVLELSNILRRYWPWLLLGMVLLIGLGYAGIRATFPPAARSQAAHLIPLLGPMRENFAAARFCRMLSLLVSGQTPLPEAIRLAGAAAGPGLAAGGERLAMEVEAGIPPGEAALQTGVLPRWITPILRWHDRGPAFCEALDAAADVCIARSQSQITLATIATEPAVIVFIGLTIGLSVLSILMPLVKLLNELS